MKRAIKTAIAVILTTAFASIAMAGGNTDCGNMQGGSLTRGPKLVTYNPSESEIATSGTVKRPTAR